MHVLLVGTGYMAVEYSKVLEGLKIEYTVVGNSKSGCVQFQKQTGKSAYEGGLSNQFPKIELPFTHAIVATNVEFLEEHTEYLIDKGVPNILVEKPLSVTLEGMRRVKEKAEKSDINVYIAFNRRFYSSVLTAQKLIEEDGGLTSFTFDFTEWLHVIESLEGKNFEKENLLLSNSVHVLDLAFSFGGQAKEIKSISTTPLSWHSSGSIFVGAGVTNLNIPFSYHANWGSAGTWRLDLYTQESRYIFRPLEKLKVQKKKSVAIEKVELCDEWDQLYKPGLYVMVSDFLFNNGEQQLKINDAYVNLQSYLKIRGVER